MEQKPVLVGQDPAVAPLLTQKTWQGPVLLCSEEPWYNVNVEMWATTHTTMDTRGNKGEGDH